jgi:hypothetical protein
VSRPPFPGFPRYPPGDPRNAAWERSMRIYTERVEQGHSHFLRRVRNVVELVLIVCLFAIWELVR